MSELTVDAEWTVSAPLVTTRPGPTASEADGYCFLCGATAGRAGDGTLTEHPGDGAGPCPGVGLSPRTTRVIAALRVLGIRGR